VKFLDVVTRDWKPEGYRLVRVAGIDRNSSVSVCFVAREQQHTYALIAIPIVEEEERSVPDLGKATSNRNKLSHQLDDSPAGKS
jgi:hypothetical protein